MAPNEGDVLLSLKCSIKGEIWPVAQPALLDHARHLHVLHGLQRLGARVALARRAVDLTHDAFDLLDTGSPREVSIQTVPRDGSGHKPATALQGIRGKRPLRTW
ncbi:hypothetical protein ABZU76_07510 [Amycolatopsis sp. NPDC005232]|uniref:hypothetical protein n=1 Tax=Amycolatopsis sp. NPDC005232 TaxID=3157027 RepID=UPI0033A8754D